MLSFQRIEYDLSKLANKHRDRVAWIALSRRPDKFVWEVNVAGIRRASAKSWSYWSWELTRADVCTEAVWWEFLLLLDKWIAKRRKVR
jgi:hypothetical protein